MRKNPLSNMSACGGIITSEFLENIRGEKVANQNVQPESFATFNAAAPKNIAELDQKIVDSWDRLRERWDSLSNRYLKMNVSLPDKGQQIIYDGDVRIAKPDFYYKKEKITLFIDGPAHDEDYVKRDDEDKRRKLKALGYRVYVVHHANLAEGMGKLRRAFD